MENVDKRLVMRLAGPGMIGGAAGAYTLVTVPGERIRPIVSAYLLVMGLVILWRRDGKSLCAARRTAAKL